MASPQQTIDIFTSTMEDLTAVMSHEIDFPARR